MLRALGMTALVLALVPARPCRRLDGDAPRPHPDPSPPEHAAHHHHHHEHASPAAAELTPVQGDEEALQTVESHFSSERYGLLPTPNVATPVLNPLVLPTTFPDRHPSDPDLYIPIVEPGSPRPVSHGDRGRLRPEHGRKIKIPDDGTLWTKLPNMKHLVEIVPIKHQSKGKALAYIVPNSHSVKKKLKKEKRISGIVLDRDLPDLSVFGSSEENPSAGSSDSKSSISESDSTESTSSEYDDSAPSHDHANGTGFKTAIEKSAPEYDSTSENHINDKLNDIVSYFKQHKNVNFDSLIHDVLPEDGANPEYHVHYIIHKKHPPSKSHSSGKEHPHSDETRIKPKEYDASLKQSHVHSQFDDPKVVHHHHHHPKDEESSSEKSTHLSYKSEEHAAGAHRDTVRGGHGAGRDLPHSAQNSDEHPHTPEVVRYSTEESHENVPVESIEAQNLIHEGSVESEKELKQLYEFLSEIEREQGALINHGAVNYHDTSASYETQEKLEVTVDGDEPTSHEAPNHHETKTNHETPIHHGTLIHYDENPRPPPAHIGTHTNTGDQPDAFDDSSSEYYSDSIVDDDLSDKSQSDADFTKRDSVDTHSHSASAPPSASEPISSSDSEQSFENISYRIDSPETHDDVHRSPLVTETESEQLASEDVSESQHFLHSVEVDTPEMLSIESTSPTSSVQLEQETQHVADDLTKHDFIFPDCLKSKNKKSKECDRRCGGHKSYSLTFLFNR